MSTVLATLYGTPLDLIGSLETWQTMLVFAVLISAKIGMAGFVLARAGISPLWALVLLVPYLDLIGLWAFAYTRWPALDRTQRRR